MARIELAPEILDDFDRILDHLEEFGVEDASERISEILQAAREAGDAAELVLLAATELSRSGETLSGQVDSFLREIRT